MREKPIALAEKREHGIALSGVIDFNSTPALARDAGAMLAFDHDIDVDLSQVSQINSAGLALLLSWRARAEDAGKKIRFNGAPEQLKQLVKINQLSEMLAI